MSVIIFLLAFTALFSYLYSLLALNSLWFIILYIFLGFITSIIFLIILVFIFIFITGKCKATNKYNHAILYQLLNFVRIVLIIKLEVEGNENIPNETFVVYGNHKSNCDVILVYLAYKRVMSAVAKKDLAQIPILKTIMKNFDVTPLDRENEREGVKALLHAIKLVKNGYNMIIFPEGGIKTREYETMCGFKAGSFKLATKAEATISPISIIGSSKISKNYPWKKTKVKIVIHKPIQSSVYLKENTFEIGDEVSKMIDEGVLTGQIQELK